MFDTICLAGCGLKGLSFISCIDYLYKKKYIQNIKKLVGTSIGSIICFLINIGYTPEDLITLFLNLDFKKFEPEFDCEILFTNFGYDTGNKIINMIKTLLLNKFNTYNITFQKLFELTNIELIIIATNYTLKKEEPFSYINTPDFDVITAINMSICIPFLFTPITHNNNIYIDGGFTNNFGLEYCNPDTTIGLYSFDTSNNSMNDLMDFMYGIIKIMFNQYDKINNFVCINISTNFNIISYDLNIQEKKDMFQAGYQYAQQFHYRNVSKEIINNIILNIENEK